MTIEMIYKCDLCRDEVKINDGSKRIKFSKDKMELRNLYDKEASDAIICSKCIKCLKIPQEVMTIS